MLPALSALLLAFSMPLTSHGVAIRNPAVEPRQAQALQAETKPVPLANGIPLRIMPLGASITFGVESSDGNGYRNDVRKALVAGGNPVNMVGSQRGGTMKDNENEGYPGLRIGQVKDQALPALKEMKPNVVLINLGTNDAGQDFFVDSAKDRMGELIGLIFNRTDKTATVVLSTLLPNKNETTAKNVDIINEGYVKLVERFRKEKKRIVLADMSGPDGPKLSTDFADETHPNDLGYAKMAKIWLKAIREASKEGLLHRAVKVTGVADDGDSEAKS